MGTFEVFPHTADLGLRVSAESREELFQLAARGLFAIIAANLDEVQTRESVDFDIPGEEDDYLLFDWLSELLYTFESRHLLLSQFEVHTGDSGLQATARGETVDPHRHHLEHEVKAITYHGLQVREVQGSWQAEVIVDI